MLAAADQENSEYIFKSQMQVIEFNNYEIIKFLHIIHYYINYFQDLRNNLTQIRLASSTSLVSSTTLLHAQIESLTQKFNDRIINLKSDITIELSNRKSETREQSKAIDLRVQEANHELRLRMR